MNYMKIFIHYLPALLQIAAAGQLAIAILNLFLVPLMGWREEVRAMPLLLREVFQVHAWFISVTLVIFAAMTFRFGVEMARGDVPVYRWLAGAVGCFWAFRTVLQVGYYSSRHWRGNGSRTVIHVTLLFLYGGLAGLYLYTSLH
jgi:hypothetical protein